MAVFDLTLKAEGLGKDLESMNDAIRANMEGAVESLSEMVYSQGQVYASERLNQTRNLYLRGLKHDKLANNLYIVYLDNDVEYLEDGYSSYDMKEGLLSGPKAKRTSKGVRYNTVPFFHQPESKIPLNQAQMELRGNLRALIKYHKLDRIMKSKSGKPLQGVVARLSGNDMAANLKGLVKIQQTYEKKTESYYMTFRRVSDNTPDNKWIHPGYNGAQVFPDLEQWTDRKIEETLKEILS